jgi:hypothetical protein
LIISVNVQLSYVELSIVFKTSEPNESLMKIDTIKR